MNPDTERSTKRSRHPKGDGYNILRRDGRWIGDNGRKTAKRVWIESDCVTYW